ncbi:MAG: DUF2892 domain-containing protein [Myxococcaceae bacterium]|jgi:hypothetical protein|nr:MAG: DUF2892 domain-containing protein [Myxococcaceae bacterium]
MDIKKLVTLTFDKNVGTADRAFRLASGLALVGAAWWLRPGAASWALGVLGLMWTATGVLSRCSIYYLLGYSTCPVAKKELPGRG